MGPNLIWFKSFDTNEKHAKKQSSSKTLKNFFTKSLKSKHRNICALRQMIRIKLVYGIFQNFKMFMSILCKSNYFSGVQPKSSYRSLSCIFSAKTLTTSLWRFLAAQRRGVRSLSSLILMFSTLSTINLHNSR